MLIPLCDVSIAISLLRAGYRVGHLPWKPEATVRYRERERGADSVIIIASRHRFRSINKKSNNNLRARGEDEDKDEEEERGRVADLFLHFYSGSGCTSGLPSAAAFPQVQRDPATADR